MEFYQAVEQRRSQRGYKNETVPQDALARITNAIQHAPTACNRQPYRILFVRNPVLRAKICEVYTQEWLKEAPIIAVTLSDNTSCWKRLEGDPIADVDATIAMEHFVLAAAAEGLGTCWICAFDRARMARALHLEEPWRAFAISPLGYAKENATRPIASKPLSELVQVLD